MMTSNQLRHLSSVISFDASHASDTAIESAAKSLEIIIDAARNSNHLGEVRTLRAAAAGDLDAALRAVLPYCAEAPEDVLATAFQALAKARGQTLSVSRKVA